MLAGQHISAARADVNKVSNLQAQADAAFKEACDTNNDVYKSAFLLPGEIENIWRLAYLAGHTAGLDAAKTLWEEQKNG